MVSTLKIELDGNLITGRIDGIEQFTVTYRRRNEEGNQSTSFSSELTFYDDGYDWIYPKLINNVNGFNETIAVKIYDDCCSKVVFEGIIRGDSIDWCSNGCYVSANIIEEEAALNCVKSTLIWNNRFGFLQRNHPIIRYCVETRPDFIASLLFMLGIFSSMSFNLIFLPIIAFLSIFAPNAADDLRAVRDTINSFYVQCGRYHPSPYLRDYIKNVCDICGLTFNSSILNGDTKPYSNWGNIYLDSVLVSAPVKKGRPRTDNNDTLIGDNVPNETLDTLMTNYLEPLFNAEYRIVGSILYFERKDFFQNTTPWIDFEQLLASNKIHDNKVCWSWIDKPRPAFGDFKYSMDQIEYVGNEAISRWNDIVEWNPAPINKSQSGSKLVNPQLGCSRYRKDGLEPGSVFDDPKIAPYNFLLNLSGSSPFTNYKDVMTVAQHTFALYKIVLYDARYNRDGRVQRDQFSNAFCGGSPDNTAANVRYNYPYWFNEKYKNNLYTLFHYIDNPRLPGTSNFNFDFTFDFDCGAFDTFSFDKTVGGLNLNGSIVNGKINEIVVNFTNRTIKVTGIA
jgi:hypothetical protein